jgi:hypothetical protein
MTNTALKAQIDSQITNETSANAITPTDVGTNLKAVVDYVDQQVPFLSYSALLSCTDGATVDVALLASNLGTVEWTRNSAGNYSGTLTDKFTIGKTLVLLSVNNGYYVGLNSTTNFSNDSIFLEVFNTNTFAPVDYIENVGIEIRVYN